MAILIVEDSPTVADMLQAVLAEGGFDEIFISHSGEKALDFLAGRKSAASPIDLILLDVLLPGINGLEVCRRLKNIEELSLIPVIIVTARNDEQTMAEAFAAGAWDFLAKPVHGPELIIRVQAALNKIRDFEKRLAQAALPGP